MIALGFLGYSAICLAGIILVARRYKPSPLMSLNILIVPKNAQERRQVLGYYLVTAIILLWVIGFMAFYG